MTEHDDAVDESSSASVERLWRIVTADDDHELPCTIVDSNGKSLLGIHNGTPIIRDRALTERILSLLNASSLPSVTPDAERPTEGEVG